MYIKSIVLDGFKSYGKRTEITGFDKEFNAITGLNGTGKSNILDSICFVLGITNLSNVRVGSLQDLVYKSGQSGITKATVSITFDNRNKNQCPVGFQDYDEITVTRQVVMGGKNKYLINGTNVQNKKVQDLFCSVQLNVNNPHFLIMQGRITKVLNMKPPEILAMIEEAAGTRMYESKRQIAQKTLDKKDLKILQMNDIITTEICPKIDKLKEERRAYLEFQRIEREIEHMTLKFTAWQYVQVKKQLVEASQHLEINESEIQKLQDDIEDNNKQAYDIDQKIAEIQSKDTIIDSKLSEKEAVLKEKEMILAKTNAAEKSAKENITTEENRKEQLIKSKADDEISLATKRREMHELNDMFHTLKSTEAADAVAYAAAEKKFEAVNAGMEIGDDGEAATLQEQLISAKQQAMQSATEAKQSTMQLQHCQTQLKEKQKELGSTAMDYKKDKNNLDNMEKEVKILEKQLGNMNFDENKITELTERRQMLIHECRSLREKLDRFECRYPLTSFQYQDPEPNFNRRSVKGLVCKLINLKDKSTATALETAAGNRLYNVIVDNDITSKKLLQRGQLQNRTTIIPLNKIKGHVIPTNIVHLAEEMVGKENVQPALSLLQYNKELQPAMEYIFGGVFICNDMTVARQITFNPQIKRKCVTLEGDVTDPSGTLTGGARRKGEAMLLLLEDIKNYQAQLTAKEQELIKTENELKNMSQIAEKYNSFKQRYELRNHELSLVRQRLQQTSHHQQQEEINSLKRTIEELTENVKVCDEQEKSCSAKAKELENRIKNSKNDREAKVKDAEQNMMKLKKKLENSRNHWKLKEQDFESFKLEISELEKAIIKGQDQIEKSEAALGDLKQQLTKTMEQAKEAKEEVTKLQAEVKEQKQIINEKNKGIQKKLQLKQKLLAQVLEIELEIKKKSHQLDELKSKHTDVKTKEVELGKKFKNDPSRLQDAEKMTNKEGHELGRRIANSQEIRNKLSRTVNTKAQHMMDQEVKTYTNLSKKKAVVENDKKKIILVMKDLDNKKKEAVNVAWNQISKDFGSIFGTLLPGSSAKLQPPENKTVLEGLEIKVSIGGIWKESLSELSGGQKSLVALSLILSMLLFKPAPIYILDEVDAALDLSHTQNIGNMLKKHFKQSQFLIVSLKDGMFNNANVLFQTQFVDGMSNVIRTVNRSQQ